MCVISRLILNTKFFNKRILCTSIMSTLMIFSSVFMMTNLQATENTYIRHVTPRGDLASDEKNTIALFENSRDSVVYISTSSRRWCINNHKKTDALTQTNLRQNYPDPYGFWHTKISHRVHGSDTRTNFGILSSK